MSKVLFLTLFFANLSFAAESSEPAARILCYDRFENQIWEMTGESFDDKTCIAMLIAGTVGMCFEGDADSIVNQMNSGVFEYSAWNKVNQGTAHLISEDIVTYASFEGEFVGWTRDDNELFRCPSIDKIKEYTTKLADQLESSVEYAVSRRYREDFGLPFWLASKTDN